MECFVGIGFFSWVFIKLVFYDVKCFILNEYKYFFKFCIKIIVFKLIIIIFKLVIIFKLIIIIMIIVLILIIIIIIYIILECIVEFIKYIIS